MGGTLIVSLDFELLWGMLDQSNAEDYKENVLGGRKAIPRLLDMFRKYGIHATWATVGFLFANDQEELVSCLPQEELRPTYCNKNLLPYPEIGNIGNGEADAPCFFGASLLNQIAQTSGQEIGSHTFSHYYCREEGQTPAQFAADMRAAREIAQKHGFALTSVVLPRNQCEPEYTEVLRNLGFTAYRDEENDWIHEKVKFRPLMRLLRLADVYVPLTGQGGYVPRNENGIWNLVGSRMYKPIFSPLRFLEKAKISRIKGQMRHAAKHNLTFHLWWHPHNVGVRTEEHLAQLEEIFDYYLTLKEKYGMESLNMAEAVEKYKEQEGNA